MANASGRFFGWVMGSRAARGAGRGLAGVGLGPERRHARRDPGVVAVEEVAGGLAPRAARPAAGLAPSASRPAPRWRTSPAWPRRATRCCAGPAGTSRPTGCPARRGCGCWSAPRGTDRSCWRCATSASGVPEQVAVDAQGRLDADDLAPPAGGRRRARRSSACRPATSTPARSTRWPGRSRSPRAPAPGCTSTARSGSGPPSSRRSRPWSTGLAGADSWATDAHKTLNTPYDGGIAIVPTPRAVHRAMGVHASYLLHAVDGRPARAGAGDVAPRARRAGLGGARLARRRRRAGPRRGAGPRGPAARRRASARSRAPSSSTTSSTRR